MRATVWFLRFAAFVGFAIGVAIVACFNPEPQFFEPPSVSEALALLEGNTLRAGAAAALVGIALRSGGDRVIFRPGLALAAAGAVKLVACIRAFVHVASAYSRHSMHIERSEIVRRVVAEEVGSVAVALVAGLVAAVLVLFLLTRSGMTMRVARPVAYIAARPWLGCVVAAVVLESLMGFHGMDSYLIGLPIPFYDSMGPAFTVGSILQFVLVLVLDVAVVAGVCFGVSSVLERVRRRRRAQRGAEPPNPALQPTPQSRRG